MKRNLALSLVIVMFFVFYTVHADNTNFGMAALRDITKFYVSKYTFEGNLEDYSGNGFNASIIGHDINTALSKVTYEPGIHGQALRLNNDPIGDARLKSGVKLPNNLLSGLENATISVFVKQDTSNPANQPWRSGTMPWTIGASHLDGPTGHIVTGVQSGRWPPSTAKTFTNYFDGSLSRVILGNNVINFTNTTVESNKWYNLTTVFNGNMVEYYIDGVLKDRRTDTRFNIANFSSVEGGNYLGISPFPDADFNGWFDDFTIYSIALTEEEVKSIGKPITNQNIQPGFIDENGMFTSIGGIININTKTNFPGAELPLSSLPKTVTDTDGNEFSIVLDFGWNSDLEYTDEVIKIYYRAGMNTDLCDGSVSSNYSHSNFKRQMESLSRGLVAVMVDDGVFLSWRLYDNEDHRFGSSTENVLFNIYRDNKLINKNRTSTNYTDKNGNINSTYQVEAVRKNIVGPLSAPVRPLNNNYFDIPLVSPAPFVRDFYHVWNPATESFNRVPLANSSEIQTFTYLPGDGSTGDLNGDGEYEIVVKWDANPADNSHHGITGNVYFHAYKLNGTKMWEIDLGRNIRSGEHYTPFVIYDFDGDGKAEVAMKTGPDSKDGCGNFVTEASDDQTIRATDNSLIYANEGGHVLNGPEFFTVFSGLNGKALNTIYYPVPRGHTWGWGDNGSTQGNRIERYTGGLAWLPGIDGTVRPSAVIGRGYYARTTMSAFQFVNGKIIVPTVFDTSNYPNGWMFETNGNHNLAIADADGDGKDEIFLGSLALTTNEEGKFTVLWCSFRGHGDALHIGDYDPTQPGFEFFTIYEWGGQSANLGGKVNDYGCTVYDAMTGREMLHIPGGGDGGRGKMGNFGIGGYYQMFAARTQAYIALGNDEFEQWNGSWPPMNSRVFWDGDLYDEGLSGTYISSWNGTVFTDIFEAIGCRSINGTKWNPTLTADLFGDWREEVIWPLNDNSALRVFTTTYHTDYKIKTLMHDPVYRGGVAAQNAGYNQPPHVGLYLDDSLFNPLIDIEVTPPTKTNYAVGEEFDLNGLSVTAVYEDKVNGGQIREKVKGYDISRYDKFATGQQHITVTFQAKQKDFIVNVGTDFEIDDKGMIIGYLGNKAQVVLPFTINGVQVAGFLENSLVGSSFSKINIYQENLTFPISGMVFDSSVEITCYDNSDIHHYAQRNGFTITSIGVENLIFEDFDGENYNGFIIGENNTQDISPFRYTVPSLGRPGISGFAVDTRNERRYLRADVGSYSVDWRRPFITLNGVPLLSSIPYLTMSMDLHFDYVDGRKAKIVLSDGKKDVDIITSDMLGGCNKWVNYSLVYSNGVYTRILREMSGEILSIESLAATPGTNGVSFIYITPDSSGTNHSQWYGSSVRIDNLMVSKIEQGISNLTIHVKDADNHPIKMATVKLNNNKTVITDDNGNASTRVNVGRQLVEVSAPLYGTVNLNVPAYGSQALGYATLKKETVNCKSATFLRPKIVMHENTAAELNINLTPSDVNEPYIISIDNTSVAEIIDNKYVVATGMGQATLAVIAESGATAVSNLTVIAGGYDQVATSIQILGPDKVYISNLEAVKSPEFRAFVLDQYGVEMQGEIVSWSLRDGEYIDIKPINDVAMKLSIPTNASAKTLTICASTINGVNTEKQISVTKDTDDFFVPIAVTDFSDISDFILFQGGASLKHNNMEFVPGSSGPNSRSIIKVGALGNGVRGFSVEPGVAHQTSGREPRILFDQVPLFSKESLYVFEMDIRFPTPPKNDNGDFRNAMVMLRGWSGYNNGNEPINWDLANISPITKDLEYEQWYYYVVTCQNGICTEYITNKSTFETTVRTLPSWVARIDSIIFTVNNGFAAQSQIANINYFSTKTKTTDLKIKVRDEHGKPLGGVTVNVGGVTAVTDQFGGADVVVLNGAYNLKANIYGKETSKFILANGSPQFCDITLFTSTTSKIIAEKNGFTHIETLSDIPTTANTILVKRDSKRKLIDIKIGTKIIQEGETIHSIESKDSKLLLWSSLYNMKPILEMHKEGAPDDTKR